MNHRYRVLGVNDDIDYCDCCGKQNLKKVVWIEDTETGAIDHFGEVCAKNPAKAFGANIKAEIKDAVKTWKQIEDAAWSLGGRRYRAQGGKYQSNGIPLHLDGGALIPVNTVLYQECFEQAKAELRARYELKARAA